MTAKQHAPIALDSRAWRLLRNRRMLGLLMSLGCILIVAITAFGFSGAYFTSSSSSPANAITAGYLKMALSQDGPIIDGANFVPGTTRQGKQTATILNGRGHLLVSTTGLAGDTRLADTLTVVLTQTSPPLDDPLFRGTLRELQNVDLGAFDAPDEPPDGAPASRTYQIQVLWPASASDAALQGATMSFSFSWQMVSSP